MGARGVPEYKLGEGPYGSAYKGTIDDLFASGDLLPIEAGDRVFGLFLGKFDWVQTVRQVWQEPARGVFGWLTKWQVRRHHTEIFPQIQDLRFTGDHHHLIVASSGSGKFRDVLSNMLIYDGSCETACLIIDPKGEIASTIGPIIDKPGATNPRTAILDPWDVCGTGGTEALTLLDGIRSDNPHCVKDARVLAEAIVVEHGTEDGHWAVTARNFLAALLLYVGLDKREEDDRTLFRLRQIVTLPWAFPGVDDDKRPPCLADLLGFLSDSSLFEGLVARTAQGMLNRSEKERRTILSTLERDTAFIEDPSLWKAIKSSSFDINQLVLTNKRLHVIVPFDYTEQMKSWLRLTIAAFYNACLRNRLPAELPRYLQFRHIIIDEFAGLGKLDFIMKGIAEARGAGLKYHLTVQNFPQLKTLYGEGWENLVSNSFIHAFGVNENFTAEYLSKMTGQATVITESHGYSNSQTKGTSSTKGSSSSSGHGGSTSGSSSSTSTSESVTVGSSTTYSSVGRPVLMPDEIRRLPETQQLLFVRQMPALLSRRVPYFEAFKGFLPKYTLKDVLAASRALAGKRAFTPYGVANLRGKGHLAEVNSKLRLSAFIPPSPRTYTFKEALLQSPVLIAVVLCLVGVLIWQGAVEIADWRQLRYQEAAAEAVARVQASDTRTAVEASDCIDRVSSSEAADYDACLQIYRTGVPAGTKYASLVSRRDARIGLQRRAGEAALLWRRLSEALEAAGRAPSPQTDQVVRDLLSQARTISAAPTDEQRHLIDRAGAIGRALENSETRRGALRVAAQHWGTRSGIDYEDYSKARAAITAYDHKAFSADDQRAWETLDAADALIAWSTREITAADRAQLPIAIVKRNQAEHDHGLAAALAEDLRAAGFGHIVKDVATAAVLIELMDIRKRDDGTGNGTRKHVGYDEAEYQVTFGFGLRLVWIGAHGPPPEKIADVDTDAMAEATHAAVEKTAAAAVASFERFLRSPRDPSR
jgi:type IV secretory pathway TraG/TraD family ATPase VirD4